MEDLTNSYQLIYSRRVKRVTLLRALASKVAFFISEVSQKDLLILFDILLEIQNKSVQDPMFNKKFGETLKVIAIILKEHRIKNNKDHSELLKLSEAFNKELQDFMIPKRNTKHVLQVQLGLVELRRGKQPGINKKKLPPKAYIGVGYRDKGSARNLAEDGSPTWQEVSQARLWLEESKT